MGQLFRFLGRMFSDVMRIIEHMDTHHWVIVFIVAIAIGALCMRGYGSRKAF
ncbi:MAG: hypothetical protein ABSF26_08710 [Thermoguttaceae bacterium]|jgi:hypothetical protein